MPRRSCLLVLLAGILTSCHSAGRAVSTTHDTTGSFGRPTIFGRGEGEARLMRGTRPLFIVADSATVGSRTLVAGYEDVAPGDSGRVHMHLQEDEILFIHRGEMEIRLGDSLHRASAGATIFVPRRTWVGFRAVGPDTAGFFFVFNSPAFEKCLRAQSSLVGERYVPMSEDVSRRIGQDCHRVTKGP